MQIKKRVNFGNIYNATAYVQSHTLINRGITTIGGSTIPQCIMSNNKEEAKERATMGIIYFIASYLTPILLLPLYNKHFLKNKGITKTLNGVAKKIIEVPKKYLTPNGDLKKGLEETAQLFDKKSGSNKHKQAFFEIYERYNNSEQLKKDLLSVHEKILMTDFITTAAMWSAIPWIVTEATEKRTKRTDFSGGFNLKKSTFTQQEKMNKKEKLLWNVVLSIVPGILFAKAVTKGLSISNKVLKNENIFYKFLKKLTKNPDNFDYISGTNMSKTIYASIWLLSSFPAKLISSRDNNERKDRALRDAGLFTMFFGGDFLLNNILGRISDKLFNTKIINTDKYKGQTLNFLQRFKLPIRNFKSLEKLDSVPLQTIKNTKNIGAALYWVSLLTNAALIGFGLPKLLNKFLKHNIEKEEQNHTNLLNTLKKSRPFGRLPDLGRRF